MLEALESRRQMSATLTGGDLHIIGTDGTDVIQFNNGKTTTTIVSVIDGVTMPTQTFRNSDITRVIAELGDGNDTFIMGKSAIQSIIRGGTGNDILSAGKGNDSIFGENGNDYIFGNDGKDTVDGGMGGDDMLGGAQKDLLDYSARTSTGVIVSLGINADDGELLEGDNAHTDFEILRGTEFGDTLKTDSGRAVEIWGLGGVDAITGGGGADSLHGGSGLDILVGMGGDDHFFTLDLELDIVTGGGGVNSMGDYDTLLDQLTGIVGL